MVNSLICPNILTINPDLGPREFQNFHVIALLDAFNDCENNGGRPYIIQKTYERYCSSAPWNLSNDPTWGRLLRDWKDAIFPKIDRYLINITPNIINHSCNAIQSTSPDEKIQWLTLITAPAAFISKGPFLVLVSTNCSPTSCHTLPVSNLDNIVISIKLIRFPWLAYYDRRLPVSGAFPFVPPKDWNRSGRVKRGDSSGFIDLNGREWVHDTERRDHWDVQLKDGSHININYNGEKIS